MDLENKFSYHFLEGLTLTVDLPLYFQTPVIT